jgi:hypothetical protein
MDQPRRRDGATIPRPGDVRRTVTRALGACVVADDALGYKPTGDRDTNADGRGPAVLAARTLDLEATIGSPHKHGRVIVRLGRDGHGGAR